MVGDPVIKSVRDLLLGFEKHPGSVVYRTDCQIRLRKPGARRVGALCWFDSKELRDCLPSF